MAYLWRAMKPKKSTSISAALQRLEKLRGSFGYNASAEKKRQLESLRTSTISRPSELLKYHDLLGFFRGYPDNAGLLTLVERELRNFRNRVDSLRNKQNLDSTGIVGTITRYSYSFEMAQLLQKWHSKAMAIDWDESPSNLEDNLLELLPHLVSWHEHDGLENDDDFDIHQWLKMAGGRGQSDLYTLISRIQSSELPYLSQRLLYDAIELSVTWEMASSEATRTLKRLPCRKVFFQKDNFVGRSRDLRARLEEPAPAFRRLSVGAGKRYVRAVNEVLATRNRELYPITLAIPEEVYLAKVGRGVEIALFGSQPEVRLPLESNFGAMLIRNGLPIGYGVGAVLFDRVEIAINVFPAFRGGESAYIIEEFFRVFYHHFGSRVFLVRSMQMGHGEEEALLSGAFWFYYKLGFRAINESVRALAEREQKKIKSNRRYRSGLSVMKRLANTDVVFFADNRSVEGFHELQLDNLGYRVTRYLGREADGDRRLGEGLAEKKVARILGIGNLSRWTPNERMAFARLAPIVASVPNLSRWSSLEKSQLARIMRAKGSNSERDFVLWSIKHARLRSSLEQLAKIFKRPS